MGRLTGKIALISGASRGQGGAEARLFAAEGAAVVLTDVLDQEGDALAATLRNEGADAVYRHLDVTSSHGWEVVIEQVGFARPDPLRSARTRGSRHPRQRDPTRRD